MLIRGTTRLSASTSDLQGSRSQAGFPVVGQLRPRLLITLSMIICLENTLGSRQQVIKAPDERVNECRSEGRSVCLRSTSGRMGYLFGSTAPVQVRHLSTLHHQPDKEPLRMPLQLQATLDKQRRRRRRLLSHLLCWFGPASPSEYAWLLPETSWKLLRLRTTEKKRIYTHTYTLLTPSHRLTNPRRAAPPLCPNHDTPHNHNRYLSILGSSCCC